MGTDLYKIIKSNQDLSEEHYKFIFYQICRAILYLHSANIIHRDIKPSNVLINEDCIIKLCDFGLSRNLRDGEQLSLTEYVVTRYYRAPEVMLCSHQYSKSVDIWSIGCTFAEMLSKNYLFPGDNYLTQIKLFIEVLGSPQEEDIEFITNGHAKNYVLNFKNIPKKNMAEIVNCDDSNAVDLLEKMLVFNPGKRITIDEIMKHPYTSSIKESGVVDPLYTGNINFDFD
jgi:mitogen-activated protein kinase 1/3